MTVLQSVIWLAMALLGCAVLIGLVVAARSSDTPSRAIAGDLMYLSSVGLLVMLGIVVDSTVILDAAMLASFIGILATIALARIISRGRR